MIGVIIGDIIGSRFEKRDPPISTSFDLFTPKNIFTDDTILSAAVAESLLYGKNYEVVYRDYFKRYPYAGYGSAFKLWAVSENGVTANSFGNGSAMRVSPIAWVFDTEEDVLREAETSALPSHNHPEGIKGAQAIAMATYMARKGGSKQEIREYITQMGYDIDGSVSDKRPKFSSACSITVPQAVWAFLESSSFIDAIKKAIMIGGDADTLAAMSGAIAHAYYGTDSISPEIVKTSFGLLTKDLFDISKEFIVQHVDSGFDLEFVDKKTAEQEEFGFLFV